MACEKVGEFFSIRIKCTTRKNKNNHSGLQKFTKWRQQIKKLVPPKKTVGAKGKNSDSL